MGTTKSSVSRFPNGIATNEIQQNMGQFILPDVTQAHVFFDDFNSIIPLGGYVLTGSAPPDILDEDGGVVLAETTAMDNNLTSLQWFKGIFQFESGKQLWAKYTFKVSEVLQSEVVVGLQITNITPFTGVTDGVFFRKIDGDATLQLVVVKDSIETVTDVLEMIDDTYVTVGFYFDGANKISIFSLNEGIAKSSVLNLPDDEVLAPIFAVKTGEAAVKNLSVDYMFVAKER